MLDLYDCDGAETEGENDVGVVRGRLIAAAEADECVAAFLSARLRISSAAAERSCGAALERGIGV